MNTNISAVGTGILTALASSVCCITPILAAVSGVTGLAGAFSWIEPIRPYMIAATVGALGLAWYLKLRPLPKDQCGCEHPQKQSFFQGKPFLGIVTVVAVLLMAFPAYACLLTTEPSYSNQLSIPINQENVTFYEVPLVCGAAPDIACGSRIKPLFIETGKQGSIKESWINRPGTVIAIVWNEPVPDKAERDRLMNPLFEKHTIDASPISNPKEIKKQIASLQGKDKWYKGMEVDQLSIEEAGVIAGSVTDLAEGEGLISEQEAVAIRKEVEEYFKKELTVVRTFENLKSAETQDRWYSDTYQTYVRHIGEERAAKVKALYAEDNKKKETCKPGKKSCCDKKSKKDCCKSK